MTICCCHWQQNMATDQPTVEQPTDRPSSDKNEKKHARFVRLEIKNVLITSQNLVYKNLKNTLLWRML